MIFFNSEYLNMRKATIIGLTVIYEVNPSWLGAQLTGVEIRFNLYKAFPILAT